MIPQRRNPGWRAGASDRVSSGGIRPKSSTFPKRKQQIATIAKNDREEVQVFLGNFGPVRFMQFRVFVRDDEMLPVESGFSLDVQQIDQLLAAITLAKAEAVRKGWLQ